MEPLRQLLGVERFGPGDPQRRAALGRHRLQHRGMGREGLAQNAGTFAVGGVEAPHVGFLKAMGDEARGGLLVVGADVAHHQPAQRAQLADQLRRPDNEAEPQTVRERLRQAAQVEHSLRAVEALQRRCRAAREIELALVVVLDDDEVVALGARQQREASRQRHRHGGRALVAGRDIHIVAARQCRARHHALGVDLQQADMPGAQCKVVARVGVAGVLDADAGGRPDQQFGDQEGRLLRTTGHQDFVPVDPDAARREQAAVDLLDQRFVVAVDVVGRPAAHRTCLERFEHAAAPVAKRKQRRIELAVDEGERLALPVGRLADVALRRRLHLQALAPARRRDRREPVAAVARREVGCLEIVTDEAAAAWPTHDQPLVDQRLHRERDGHARHPERGRQQPARGQRGARQHVAFHHGVHEHVANLALQGAAAALEAAEQPLPHHVAGADGSGHGGGRRMRVAAFWPYFRGQSGMSARRAPGLRCGGPLPDSRAAPHPPR